MKTLKPHLYAAAFVLVAGSLLSACNSEEKMTDAQEENLLEVYTETAQQYYQMGDLDRAQGQVEKGLDLDPDNFMLKVILGWTLQRRGRTEDVLRAEAVFRSLAPSTDHRAVLGLAESLERKAKALSEAAENIRSGRRITEAPDPEKRADELDAKSQEAYRESLVHYERTMTLHKNDSDAINGMMRIEATLGRSEESLKWADMLLEVTQGDLEFWKKKSLRPELSAQEEDHFRDNARKLETLQVSTHLHASALEYDLHDLDSALVHIDAALGLAPDRSDLYSRRAQILKDLGRYADAIHDIESFIKTSSREYDHPDIQRAWRLRNECEQAQRQGRTGQ